MEREPRSTYLSPPILEATLEIRFAETLPDSRIAKASKKLASRYETVDHQEHIEASIDFVTRSATFASRGPRIVHLSGDQANRLVMQSASATWTRLAPYEGWDRLYDWISAELLLLESSWGRRLTERIGLRYVNRIDIPPIEGVVRYEDYFTYRLQLGELLDPQNSYQWLVTRDRRDRELKCTVQSATVEPEVPGTGAFTLDIDVSYDKFVAQAHEVEMPRSAHDMLARLPGMRQLKNELFEAGVTPSAKEKFG